MESKGEGIPNAGCRLHWSRSLGGFGGEEVDKGASSGGQSGSASWGTREVRTPSTTNLRGYLVGVELLEEIAVSLPQGPHVPALDVWAWRQSASELHKEKQKLLGRSLPALPPLYQDKGARGTRVGESERLSRGFGAGTCLPA